MNQASPMAEQPMNQVSQSELQAQNKLTIEQEEERKLKMKYPNPQKPGGSAFIQKMLHKGSKKYFDSGDYNMAKSKKQGLLNGLGKSAVATPQNNMSSTPVHQQTLTENQVTTNTATNIGSDQTMASGQFLATDLNSPMPANNTCHFSNVNKNEVFNEGQMNTPNQKVMMNVQFVNENGCSAGNSSGFLNASNSNSTSPNLSGSVVSGNNNSKNTLQSSQSIQGISSSMSSDKIALIQLNQLEDQPQLDSEDIGSTIPTPECLPQSRKHSIAQSKLATPHLLNL